MKKYFLIVLVVFLGVSCSNEKNTFLSRAYHKTTTHYNGFFNARESMRMADKSLWESHEENWDERLPLFLRGDESVYSDMETVIGKCSKAIHKHSIYIKKQEYNSWIDDTYLLMGKAFLYKKNYSKAEEIFNYVEKQFKKEPIRYEAKLWLAILNMEDRNPIKAASILQKMEEEKRKFPKHFESEFRQVYADYYLNQKEYDFAADELQKAINLERNKKRKTRLTFILAQLYNEMGKSKKSIEYFAKVMKLRPSYEMEFYSKINQALAFDTRADGTEVREVLAKLLKEKKYAEFKDQIYYALAQLEFSDHNNDEGIAYLIQSTEESVNNDRQKGKSFLSLSEIYFDQRDYRQASSYYDSTITYLPSDYPSYEAIHNTKKNLSELVGHLIIVQHQDSLLTLSELPEPELNKKLRKYIRNRQDELDEKRRLEKEQRENEIAGRLNGFDAGRKGGGKKGPGSGAWYFYNPNTKSSGYTEFRRKYGNRKYEDNWIRKDKSQNIVLDDQEEGEGGEEEVVEVNDSEKIPTLDDLKERLPMSDEDKVVTNSKIADAMYEIGRIYTEKFKDGDNAIESFEELSLRYPEEEVIPTVYYQLYILYLKKEEDKNYLAPDLRSTSIYYKNLISEDHPSSEYAAILNDPNYQTDNDKRAEEMLSKYKDTYRQYRRRNYNEVLTVCLDVINNDPSNKLMAKYHLLKAKVIEHKRDRENYVVALQEIVQKFPGTEEGDEAMRLLGLLGEKVEAKAPKKENLMAGIDTGKEGEPAPKKELPKAEYSTKLRGSHYYAMVVPDGMFDMNQAKYNFTDYNTDSFDSESLKVTTSFITKKMKLVLVRPFKDKDGAMNYYNATLQDDDLLKEINSKGFESFIISSKNFAQLFKSKDVQGYIEFFKENYLK